MDQFPANSRKVTSSPIDKPVVPAEEEVVLKPVITGKVVRRKKPLGRRFLDTFFAGEGVFAYLFRDVLVPALQDTATNMVTQGIEKAIYGEVRSHGRPVRGASSIVGSRNYTSYDRPSTIIRSSSPAPAAGPPMRRPSSQPSSMDIGEIILDDYNQAQIVAEKLLEAIQQYGCVTVANLNELLRTSSTVTDYKYGWEDLSMLQIKRVRGGGYMLDLPMPEDLK